MSGKRRKAVKKDRSPLAFMSYARFVDEHDLGQLTKFRERLSGEVQVQTGEAFPIFQDRKDIHWGQHWQERIDNSLDAVTFLIPILTPSFFKSPKCREELEKFLEREKALGRNDLILPIYYVDCPVLNDEEKRKKDKLAETIVNRQYADWRDLRFEPFTSPQVCKTLAIMAIQIRDTLEKAKSALGEAPHETRKNWGNEDIFKVNFLVTLGFQWPVPFLYVFDSAFGKTISPIGIAIYAEVANNKPIISRIISYKCRILLKYNESNPLSVSHTKDKSLKFEYKPIGKIVEKWHDLYNMGFLGNQVYYAVNNNWKQCKRIDFTQNSFDMLARKTQLKPGESIMGWMFFDLEHDDRGQRSEIKEIELSLTNSQGDSQKFIGNVPKDETGIGNFMSSATVHLTAGYYDLTKEKYEMIPYADLHKILKDGKFQKIKASDNVEQSLKDREK